VRNIIILIFLISSGIIFSQKKLDKKASDIIQKAVKAHGDKNYNDVDVSFDFRQFHYRVVQKKTTYQYQRSFSDSLGNMIVDLLDNGQFHRTINGEKVQLSERDHGRFKEATNSVAYFVLLPHKLLDKAVNLQYLGETNFEGNNYFKIKVWFDQEGGGKDFEDIYCYWINQNTYTVDYLSYANGGPRFRKATKRENVGGVVFQNYENYQILDKEIPANEYDQAFKDGKYKLLSTIEQVNYKLNK
jgi:hypothetical protein